MSGSISAHDVIQWLDVYLPHNPDGAWYRSEDLPPKKLKNAILKYAKGVTPSAVLALSDGTVFGSAKEGVLITADRLYAKTLDGTFAVDLEMITGARVTSGWPNHTIEVDCADHISYRIATICFDKQQVNLVQFLNAVAELNGVESNSPQTTTEAGAPEYAEPVFHEPVVSFAQNQPSVGDTSISAINAGLRLISVCEHRELTDTGKLFHKAFQSPEEWPLVKGYCKYVGFNKREVDGIFLLTNQRLLLFSSESGAKIFLVELTMRLLDKVPVPFFDSLVGFFLFKIPRKIYVAFRGGQEKLIERALSLDNDQLLTAKPPARKVQEFTYHQLGETVARVEIGAGIWTGILSRAFGVSFAPNGLSKTFSIPKDLILPEYETLTPFSNLLSAVNDTLAQQGLYFVVEADGQKLSIIRSSQVQSEAA